MPYLTKNPHVAFLYELLRDHIPVGAANTVVQEQKNTADWELTDRLLAEIAERTFQSLEKQKRRTRYSSVGTERIAAERRRQQRKWSPQHDDRHRDESLIKHAAGLLCRENPPVSWWLLEKCRGDRIKELTIAGALIAAEIDRLSRLTKS